MISSQRLFLQTGDMMTLRSRLTSVRSKQAARMLLATLLGLSSSSMLFSTARADNWPQWRGPKNDGVSTEKNIATE